jgi:hypothetical protein
MRISKFTSTVAVGEEVVVTVGVAVGDGGGVGVAVEVGEGVSVWVAVALGADGVGEAPARGASSSPEHPHRMQPNIALTTQNDLARRPPILTPSRSAEPEDTTAVSGAESLAAGRKRETLGRVTPRQRRASSLRASR